MNPVVRGCLVVALATVVGASTVPAQGTDLRARIVQNHLEYRPVGDGPFPTLIAIPGCSGIAFPDAGEEASHPDLREDDRLFRAHYPRAANRLRDAGFAVLLIHVHAAEDQVTACSGEIPASRIAQYIDEATDWASTLDFVDRSRLHLIGWSMGGGGVLKWLEASRAGVASVKSAVAVYPGCGSAESLSAEVPLLMLLGGADDIARPEVCQALVERSPTRAMIQLHSYPGARHGYDIEDAPARLDIGNGMTVGFQQAAASETWEAIFSFLSGA